MSKIQIKEYSVLYIMVNYLSLTAKKIEEISEITFLDDKNESIKKLIIQLLLSETNYQEIIVQLKEKFENLLQEIQDNTSIQIILKNKNEEEIADLLEEILLEIKDLHSYRTMLNIRL